MTAVLAISNRKGGSGKSTTAVNLAAEWGARGVRTLLVDLDIQGHAGLGYGVVARRQEPSVHMIFTHPGFCLNEAIRSTAVENVLVAPADLTFDGTSRERGISTLNNQLRAADITERFDLVILDTPPSLDMLLINALAAADAALVPMIPHALSTEGVRQFTRLFFRVATSIKPDLKLLGIVPVMVNARVNHQRSVLREVGIEYGRGRMLDGVRMDIELAEAFSAGLPIRAFAPFSRGAQDYRHLADELDELWPPRRHAARYSSALPAHDSAA